MTKYHNSQYGGLLFSGKIIRFTAFYFLDGYDNVAHANS